MTTHRSLLTALNAARQCFEQLEEAGAPTESILAAQAMHQAIAAKIVERKPRAVDAPGPAAES